jgi:hypothetical protein
MLPAAMLSASVHFSVMFPVVVRTAYVGVKVQRTADQLHYRGIRVSADTAEQPDPGSGQHLLRAAANPAADQRIHSVCGKESCKRAVTAAVGIGHPAGGNLTVFHRINFELLRVPKVLKNPAVFISDCNFHNDLILSFSMVILDCSGSLLLRIFTAVPVASFSTLTAVPAAHHIIAARNHQTPAVYQRVGNFSAGSVINTLYGCSRNPHLSSAFLLRACFQIDQTNRFIFVYTQDDLSHSRPGRKKLPVKRQTANLPFFGWSGHFFASFSDICRIHCNLFSGICQE